MSKEEDAARSEIDSFEAVENFIVHGTKGVTIGLHHGDEYHGASFSAWVGNRSVEEVTASLKKALGFLLAEKDAEIARLKKQLLSWLSWASCFGWASCLGCNTQVKLDRNGKCSAYGICPLCRRQVDDRTDDY